MKGKLLRKLTSGVLTSCALAIFGSLAGCALLIDPPRQVAIPSAPSLQAAPEDPHAPDELSVEVLDREAFVEYDFEWCRLDTPSSEDCVPITTGIETTLFSSTLTDDISKRFPELYRVTVTTKIVDSDITGKSATHNFEIANTPSQLVSVSLNKYRMVEGEIISALPASFIDPDNPSGVGVGLRYQWFVNDDVTPIRENIVANIRTGDFLDLGDSGLADPPQIGDVLKLIVTPTDPYQTTSTTVGPVVVLSDSTRWIPILPNRQLTAGDTSSVVYDERHERLLLVEGNVVWEATLEDSGTSFAKLYPTNFHITGIPQKAFFDGDLASKPVVVMMQFEFGGVGGNDGQVIYTLDVTQRGSEFWTRIEPTGDFPPTIDGAPTVFYDAKHDRLFMLPSCDNPSPYFWQLDVTADSATWTRKTFSSVPGIVEKTTVIPHPTVENRFLTFGGTTTELTQLGPELWECDESSEIQRSPVHRIDIPADGAPTFQAIIKSDNLPLLPPEAHSYSAAVAQPDSNQILIAEGFSNHDGTLSESEEMWSLNLDTLVFDTIALPSSPVTFATSHAVYNPNRNSFIFWRSSTVAGISDMAFAELNDVGGGFTWNRTYFEQGVHLPAELTSAQTWGSANIEVSGGLRSDQKASRALWRLTASSRKWTATTLDVEGKSRYGVVVGSRDDVPPLKYLVRGLSAVGSFVPGNPWLLDELELEWHQVDFSQTVAGEVYSESLILPLSELGCGASLAPRSFFVFGGDLLGASVNSYSYWACNAFSQSSCSATSGTAPISGRSSVAAAIFGTGTTTNTVLFGGFGADNSVIEVRPCATPVTWNTPSVTEDPTFTLPQARSDHAMTLVPGSGARTMYVSGGRLEPGGGFLIDVWRLVGDAGGPYAWTKITPVPGSENPLPRGGHVAAWDANADALLIYGGQGTGTIRSDMWELRIR